MHKLKNQLIVWLGGYTNEKDALRRGKYIAYLEVLEKMNSLYGTYSDKWCDQIYNFVINKINKI